MCRIQRQVCHSCVWNQVWHWCVRNDVRRDVLNDSLTRCILKTRFRPVSALYDMTHSCVRNDDTPWTAHTNTHTPALQKNMNVYYMYAVRDWFVCVFTHFNVKCAHNHTRICTHKCVLHVLCIMYTHRQSCTHACICKHMNIETIKEKTRTSIHKSVCTCIHTHLRTHTLTQAN